MFNENRFQKRNANVDFKRREFEMLEFFFFFFSCKSFFFSCKAISYVYKKLNSGGEGCIDERQHNG